MLFNRGHSERDAFDRDLVISGGEMGHRQRATGNGLSIAWLAANTVEAWIPARRVQRIEQRANFTGQGIRHFRHDVADG